MHESTFNTTAFKIINHDGIWMLKPIVMKPGTYMPPEPLLETLFISNNNVKANYIAKTKH
jgi:hypothetical protein